jgi:hypothetical protein
VVQILVSGFSIWSLQVVQVIIASSSPPFFVGSSSYTFRFSATT